MENIKDILYKRIRYGGISNDIYKEILPLITMENNKNMNGLTQIMAFFGLATTVLSCIGILSFNALPSYIFLLTTSIIFYLIRRYITQDNIHISHLFCLLQGISLTIFGILNSTIFTPDKNSNGTIFDVLLLVLPFLMISVPIEMDAILVILTIIYCKCVQAFKAPGVFELDTTNAIAVCIIAIMSNWIFSAKTMNNLVNKYHIERERDTDGLTGLLTKNAGQMLIKSNLERDTSGALFILDMDNFKKINDENGHFYGDEILKKLSSCIKANVDRVDVASRFGGDEFVIFYPGITKEESIEKYHSLVNSIENTFEKEKNNITCSFGISIFENKKDYDVLFKTADTALYETKENGKDSYTIKEIP